MKTRLPILAGMTAALVSSPVRLLDAPNWWVVMGGGVMLLLCLVGVVVMMIVGVATLRKK